MKALCLKMNIRTSKLSTDTDTCIRFITMLNLFIHQSRILRKHTHPHKYIMIMTNSGLNMWKECWNPKSKKDNPVSYFMFYTCSLLSFSLTSQLVPGIECPTSSVNLQPGPSSAPTLPFLPTRPTPSSQKITTETLLHEELENIRERRKLIKD